MFLRQRRRRPRTEWLWWLLFFLTAGCELLTADNPELGTYMTDDLVATPQPHYTAVIGGRRWWAPYLAHVRAAEQRPERICRYWHAAQAAWRMECDGVHPDLYSFGEPISTGEENWALYASGVQTECSPDWSELSWREVEGIGACAERIINAGCESKWEILIRCEDEGWPAPDGPVRPI